MLLILLVFHFEISGKYFNEEQFANIPSILITLFKSQLEISGKDNNEKHSEIMHS